jgi:hypothetical protein
MSEDTKKITTREFYFILFIFFLRRSEKHAMGGEARFSRHLLLRSGGKFTQNLQKSHKKMPKMIYRF